MKNCTEIVFVLDRSGSMGGLESDTIGSYNKFVKDQADIGNNANMSLILFDDKIEVVYENVQIDKVNELDRKVYNVRGTTALNDAMGTAIDNLGKRLESMKEEDRPDKIVIVAMTDGQENASQKFTTEKVKEMVKHQQEKYNWQFLFLGANIDAFAVGGGYGISADACMNFTPTAAGLNASAASNTGALRGYRAGTTKTCSYN